MKTISSALMFCILTLCSSCVPLMSIYPAWDAEHITELPGLEGTWSDPDGGTLTIAKTAAARYSVTLASDEDVSRYEVRVVDLNGRLFLDFFPDRQTLGKYLDVEGEAYLPLIPAHFFGRILLDGDWLKLGLLDDEQVSGKIEKGEAAVPLMKWERGIVMTAETQAIQSLLDRFAEDSSVWGDETTFVRNRH